MTHMEEEYKQNTIRTLAQIMEAGERLKGRGQIPWTQKLLIEELQRPKSCLKIIDEMRTVIGEMGLSVTHMSDRYKTWHMQEGNK